MQLDGLGDKSERSAWREDRDARTIVVNTDYPLYQSLGTNEDYIFESLVMHMLNDDEELSLTEAKSLFDQIIWLDRSAEDEEPSPEELDDIVP